MFKISPFLFCFFLFIAITSRGQNTDSEPVPYDRVSLGFGFGFDYGGIGTNLIVYPQKNIGLFGGVGYALAGLGYNAGVKFRILSSNPASKASLFFVGMYGYNAAVYVTNNTSYNKMFYGPTVGAGCDLKTGSNGKGYVSLALMVPIRNGDASNYIDNLKSNYGVEFKNNLWPIGFSVGYHVVLD